MRFRFKTLKLSTKLIGSMMLLNLLTTAGFTIHTYQGQKREILGNIDQKLLACAEGVRLAADRHHGFLSGGGAIPPVEVQGLNDALTRYATRANVAYLYTVIEKDGKIVFTSSSYTPEEKAKGEETKRPL